ncbi:PolC-type DNA polymerase III [Paenibacillus xylanilyticus]|uniref:3'-5' exonuclease n=1 Tax=Paenibacillus xylanilyticus TaxID=248903 RepID=UPI0039A29D7E
MKFCIFDFEATGPNEQEDQITQIGAIILEGETGRVKSKFKKLVKPSKQIPEVIEELTGIKNIDVKQASDLAETFQDFIKFSEGTILVTQAGYEYDWPLLVNECKRHNIQMLENIILDTKVLFTFLYPETNEVISTNFLIDFYGINDSDIKRHDALGDSILISRIFYEILKDYEKRDIHEINIEEPLRIKKVQLKKLV